MEHVGKSADEKRVVPCLPDTTACSGNTRERTGDPGRVVPVVDECSQRKVPLAFLVLAVLYMPRQDT